MNRLNCGSLLLCICFLIFSSCTKTNHTDQPDNPPVNGTKLDSAYTYSSYQGETQGGWSKFIYDDKGRLIEWRIKWTDTVGQYTMLDTGSYRFVYSGSDTIPTLFTEPQAIGGYDVSVVHYPQYDNTGRIIKDSQAIDPAIRAINNSQDEVDRYQYHDEYISRVNQYELDTFFFQNNNYVQYDAWGAQSVGSQIGRRYLTPSTYMSPSYLFGLSDHIGVVFSYGFCGDLLLHNLPARISDADSNNLLHLTNYSWITDDQGWVTYGTGTNVDTGTITEYYTFVYKK